MLVHALIQSFLQLPPHEPRLLDLNSALLDALRGVPPHQGGLLQFAQHQLGDDGEGRGADGGVVGEVRLGEEEFARVRLRAYLLEGGLAVDIKIGHGKFSL